MNIDNNKKVVVGIGHGVDGIVAAFLLKKQGYQIHLVSINFLNEGYKVNYKDKTGKNSEECFSFNACCSGVSNNRLKKIAETFGASFSFVDVSDQFYSRVIVPSISHRLVAKTFDCCFLCHQMLFEGLDQEAKRLEASFISCGHFSKIQLNKATDVISIMSGNDLENDQSDLLGCVPKDILKKSILPLGDLQSKEVQKIAENNGFIDFYSSLEIKRPCIPSNSNFLQFVNLSVPTGLKKEGAVLRKEDGFTLCQHQGLHDFLIGEKAPSEFESIPTDQIVVDVFQSQGKIIVSNEKDHAVKCFLIKSHHMKEGKSFFYKLPIFIKLTNFSEFIEGTISLKVAGHLEISLEAPLERYLAPGLGVTIYEKLPSGKFQLFSQGVVCHDKSSFKKTDDEESDPAAKSSDFIEL